MLRAIVESLSDIPTPIRDHYKPRDEGGYILDVEGIAGISLENVGGLKNTLSDTREKLRKSRERLENFGDLEPDAARDAITKMSEMASWTPEDKVKQQIEANAKQLMDRHRKELEVRDAKTGKLQTALERNLVAVAANSAIAKHRGVPELLVPVVERHVRMIEDGNGDYFAQVVSADGTPQISTRSGSTDPMSIDEFVEGLKTTEAYGRAFEGSGASGSGAGVGMGSGGVPRGGAKRVSSGDQEGLNRSIEDIASGKTIVSD